MVANGFSGLWYPLIVLVPKSPVKKFPEFFLRRHFLVIEANENRAPCPARMSNVSALC